jgi:hypothetical protein
MFFTNYDKDDDNDDDDGYYWSEKMMPTAGAIIINRSIGLEVYAERKYEFCSEPPYFN